MNGRIHSLETFGTLDGPGIRFVLFMQGCALQCQFCHNPDTWDTTAGRTVTVDEVLKQIEPYLKYYELSGGGITVSGGEPTLQAPFVAELFRQVKRRWNLHTALDSSGFCEPSHAKELLEVTDLVLLDFKEMNNERHIALTSQPNERIHRFARHLAEIGVPIWLRTVLIPGVTDSTEHLRGVGEFIASVDNVAKFEVLPYHRMGVYKWQQIGKKYPLEGVMEPTDKDVERACRLVEEGKSKWALAHP